jgi:hypothetical protein
MRDFRLRPGVNEIFALLNFTQLKMVFPTRPSGTICRFNQQGLNRASICLGCSPLEAGPMGCSETSVRLQFYAA